MADEKDDATQPERVTERVTDPETGAAVVDPHVPKAIRDALAGPRPRARAATTQGTQGGA